MARRTQETNRSAATRLSRTALGLTTPAETVGATPRWRSVPSTDPPPARVDPLAPSYSKQVPRWVTLRLGLVGVLVALAACSAAMPRTKAPPSGTVSSTTPTTIAPRATGVYDHTGPADLSPAVAGV